MKLFGCIGQAELVELVCSGHTFSEYVGTFTKNRNPTNTKDNSGALMVMSLSFQGQVRHLEIKMIF